MFDCFGAAGSFPLGADSFCAVIGIGTKQNGTVGVRDFKIEGAIEQLVERGDAPFTVRLVHDAGDESSKAMVEVALRPSVYLRALRAEGDGCEYVVLDGECVE